MSAPTTTSPARPSRGRRPARMSGDEREAAILAAFERLLAQRSLHEISVDEIARGAGISRPTFYFYFASKEAVLLSLLQRIIDEAQAARGDTPAQLADDPVGGIRQALMAFFEAFRSHRAVTLAGSDAWSSSAEVRELWGRAMEQWVQEATTLIERERDRGAAPPGLPARDLAVSLLWMNERVLQTAFAGQSPAVDEDRALDTLVGIWVRAIYAR
jgi:TetR/AcrR family transcriptional regulator, ethionamide resistance regulator